MFDVIAIGGSARDITFLTDKGRVIETPENLTEQRLLAFEYGAKIRSEQVRTNFGGGACNAAASFAKMGMNVAVCTRVGIDEDGDLIVQKMKNQGVDTSLIQKDDKENSGFSFMVINNGAGGERVIFVHKGANDNLEIRKEEIKETKWIYLTAMAGNWENDLERVSETMEEKDIRLAWNPGVKEIRGGKEKLMRLLKHTTVLIINKDEAIELVQSDNEVKLSDDEYNDIEKLLKVIKGWGAEAVVITDGKNGASLCVEEGILKAPAYIGEQVDTTGAGDAFGSGVVAGYILNGSWEMALKFGILNSGGTVREYGAQNGIMTREEIEENLNIIQVENHVD